MVISKGTQMSYLKTRTDYIIYYSIMTALVGLACLWLGPIALPLAVVFYLAARYDEEQTNKGR